MTHTVEGWAVQYKARNNKWCWVKYRGAIHFYVRKEDANQHKIAVSRANYCRIETRIVRVRQTTEVIES